ncbi:MAG: hypothetical protein HY847_18420 [Betaproteobacteria bacterium]|nr:hypothetical protein [Betaproteobacteria bacterium]
MLTIASFALLTGMIAWVCLRPSPQAEALPLPAITEPVLPDIQERAIARLLRLSHFRRILDGSVFDYHCGASLEICDCQQLPYPHLILPYGDKQSVVFETADALEQYVVVQETVAELLRTGMKASGPVAEGS